MSEDDAINEIIQMEPDALLKNVNQFFSPNFYKLNEKLVEVITNFSMV